MIGTRTPRRDELDGRVAGAAFLLELLDHVPEVVVFIKDVEGRYVAVNETLARRLGLRDRREILGRTTREIFPAPLGERFLAQDLALLRGGAPMSDVLELHLFPSGHEGWCLTTKTRLVGEGGAVLGLAGISRDVRLPAAAAGPLDDFAESLRLIQEGYAGPLRIEALAARAGLSPWQFGRRVQGLFGLTPARLIVRTRIDAARRLLQEGDEPIAAVALACGYGDQSAFTRQFRAVAGLTPARYRALSRERRR